MWFWGHEGAADLKPSVLTISTVCQSAVGDVSVPCAVLLWVSVRTPGRGDGKNWRTVIWDVKWTFILSKMFRWTQKEEFLPIPRLKTVFYTHRWNHRCNASQVCSAISVLQFGFNGVYKSKTWRTHLHAIHNLSKVTQNLKDFLQVSLVIENKENYYFLWL